MLNLFETDKRLNKGPFVIKTRSIDFVVILVDSLQMVRLYMGLMHGESGVVVAFMSSLHFCFLKDLQMFDLSHWFNDLSDSLRGLLRQSSYATYCIVWISCIRENHRYW